MNFSSLIGQDNAKRILTRTADRDQLPNSFLFCGPEGVGKWAAALALTAYLNCRNRNDADSCGTCPACIQIQKLQFPNLYIAVPTPPSKSEKEEIANYWDILNRKIAEPYSLIGGERQMSIPVATVRTIRSSLAQKPPQSGKRIIIIEQMDRMRTMSADALLKLVEEPPPQTLIVITTSKPDRLLPTIISRCRRLRFAPLSEEEIIDYLLGRTEVGEKNASLLARLSRGSLGRALYLASGDTEQDREVAKLIFKGIFISQPGELIAEAADILPFNDRFRINRIIGVWQTLFRDIIILKSGRDKQSLINVDFAAELEKIAGRGIHQENLLKLPSHLGTVMADIELNVDTRSAVGALLTHAHKRLIVSS
jgi:DNA polymerase-3 subunit delta'